MWLCGDNVVLPHSRRAEAASSGREVRSDSNSGEERGGMGGGRRAGIERRDGT